ncbi:MAG: hypothetical protein KAY37_04395 [Phycisphaerae bacterium]|nr:hypothetical protein [Phycisphaerae bacterium]
MKKPARIELVFVCLSAVMCLAGVAAADVQTEVLVDEGDRIVLHYHFGEFQSQTVSIDGKNYELLNLPGEPVTLEQGAPAVPLVADSIIIPDDAEMAITVLSERYYERTANIAPSKGNLLRTVDPAKVPYEFGPVYHANAFYPGKLATLREPYIMRDHRGQTVQINPCQYNAVTGVLRVYTELTIEIAAVGPGQINVLERSGRARTLSLAFHDLYCAHFVNYNTQGRYPPLDEDGDMLVICHDPWLPNMSSFVTHKNSAGISTTIVGVSTIGNNATAIKNYIQNLYNTGDLAFVLLVGDIAQIASPTASGGASDPTYAKLAGGDDYPEIMIGRFSASNSGHVDTQVQRTIEYENLPANGQAWFWKGTGIASDQGAGIGDEGQSDIVHEDEIRDWLMAVGYTEVDQIYDPGATAAEVSAALNAGRGILNYTGHGWWEGISTTGFCVDDVNALTNDNMLPFMTIVACNPGEFDTYDECFGEACLRATNGGEPTGAIGVYASSTGQSWAPPMEAQDEFNILLTDPAEPYHCYGTLCYAGSCSMMDDYGAGGISMFNTWIVFGDPSLRVIGTIGPPHGMKVTPGLGLHAEGQAGGPFTPDSIVYTLTNYDPIPITYQVSATALWLDITNPSDTIPVGGAAYVTVSINGYANGLGNGYYDDTVNFVNLTNHDGDTSRIASLTIGVPTKQMEWTLDTNPGWGIQGEWAFGHPTGQGGTQYGNPDPNNGATGTNVYGVNLLGDYSLDVGGPYYLTLGPLDLTDMTDVGLKFQRWLNSDYQPYVTATLEVSNDNTAWTTVWQNGGNEVADSAWSQYEYDLSAVADDQATVYIRWGYQVTDNAWAYSGWNIDDVEIWALAASAPPVCRGDCNCSGAINWRDIDFFVAGMNDDQAAWEAMFLPGTPTCTFANCDVNADGTVNWRDIDPLVNLMNTPCP